ncbi:MAG TPA: SufD family Fe-S cluster assembly protein, partial [Candidatus Limnocylindrales bacterium]
MTGPARTAPAGASDIANTSQRPARVPRRAPADLPFRFADPELAEALGADRSEPAWLRDDRLAAWQAFDGRPLEANQLYTPYVDLRAADLFDARPYVTDAPAGVQTAPIGDVPAGVVVETFDAWLARSPEAARAALASGATLPDDDKLAWLARGFWSAGLHVEIADGVVLHEPLSLRWPAAAPGRAFLTRTLISLGDGASAEIVEELTAAGPDIGCAAGEPVPQGLFHGTSEVILGRGASLRLASIQDLPENQIAFQQRHATIGEAASLRWALAQLGSKLVRSRVDNRLEGDRSSVEQVEIVLGATDQLFDLTSYTRHLGRDTTGNLLSKGV